LVLADALVYSSRFNPHTIIDVATLTGAVIAALGMHYTGAFTRSDELWNEINSAGLQTYEKFWRLPLDPEYRKQCDSETADIRNIGFVGHPAGSAVGAIFLSEFTDHERWIHLDIAGTALPKARDCPYQPKMGMTGVPVRALVQFVQNSISKS